MKNKLLKFINVFLATIMIFSNFSPVFASANNDDNLSVYKQGIIQKSTTQNTISDHTIFNEQNEEDNNSSNDDSNDKKQSLDTEKTQLSEEDENFIKNLKSMIENKDFNIVGEGEDKVESDESDDVDGLNKLKIIKVNEETSYTNLFMNQKESYKDYQYMDLEAKDNKTINEINIYANESVEIIKKLFTEEQIVKIQEILNRIEAYLGENEQVNHYGEIKNLIEELRSIKALYSLEDQGISVKKESSLENGNTRFLSLENKNPENNKIKLLIKINKYKGKKSDSLIRLVVKNETEEDQFSIVNEKDMPNYRSLSTMLYSNDIPVRDTETIEPDDIAPPNYLNLLANMPGASATVEPGPGVNGDDWTYQKDVIELPANTETYSEALWNGDWSEASTTLFSQFKGNDATVVRFKPSDPRARNYRKNMDAGWDRKDLNLATTRMWVKVKYKNAAYYKNEIVDCEAIIKVTPMKNRNENSYNDEDYGEDPYYPILQISHNLYKGWCWQNVREINFELVFKRKNGEVIKFDSSTFDGKNATYFTINSLHEASEHRDGSIHYLGAEYVRPDEATITGAYVIPGSNIQTSYNGGYSSGIQYAYNGGTNKWDGDDPSHPDWSKNSVLFTTANTQRLNFTMGNLMRDPEWGYVPRTNFVWTSMSTQSFTNCYVNYKDIEVIKSWIDGDDEHNPIKVNLFKNYRVKIKYKKSWWDVVTKEIEIKNLLTDTIELSNSNNWKSGFYRIPDEESQAKIIKKNYKKDKYQLLEDAGGNFPQDVPNNFEIEEVSDFQYTISEVKVPGYTTNIEKSTDINPESDLNKDIYHITNSKEGYDPGKPKPLNPKITVNKKIDYLGDGVENRDTNVQRYVNYKNQLEDIYRLYLDVEGEKLKKQEPVDLLFVLDGSSSMGTKDMSWNGEAISRKDAMIGMINNTDLVENFLKQNDQNRVAFLYFEGYARNENTKREDGYTYHEDAQIIKNWSHSFDRNIDFDFKARYMGTNYQAGLMMAEELLRKSEEQKGRRQVMIFISDGVPTFWIDSDGNRREDGRNSSTTVSNSKFYTEEFLDGFYRRHPNLITHAVGVSEDIDEENLLESKSPEVLKYMANKGKGSYIGVKSNTGELVSKLNYAIEAAVTEVRIEDTLSDRVELLADKADFKVVKINKDTGEETILWENGHETWQNGYGSNKHINSLVYDEFNKKVVLTFNPNYKLEENTKYVLSYNIKTNQQAKDDFLNNGYDAEGDRDTDYEGNNTSSEKEGFYANKIAEVYYNGGKKVYPHPVVQVKKLPSYELPTTGGTGTKLIKTVGAVVFVIAAFSLIRKKRND